MSAQLLSLTKALKGAFNRNGKVYTTVQLYDLFQSHLLKEHKAEGNSEDTYKNMHVAQYYRMLTMLESLGAIVKLKRDHYVNMLTFPKITPEELPSIIYPGAVISLHSALMGSGALNNPSRITTAITPTYKPGWNKVKKVISESPFGEAWIFRIPEDIVLADGVEHDDMFAIGYAYPMATPEKAIVDWIFIAAMQERNETKGDLPLGYPPLDIDLDKINIQRLERIAKALGLQVEIAEWLQYKTEHDNNQDVQENRSVAMGL